MEDVIVTLLNGTKIAKSKVPVGEIYINEKGQKCRKVLKAAKPEEKGTTHNIADVIVTLLDGTKIAKSKVPVGEIYINEKGQKCRKVLKAVPVTTKPETKGETFFSTMSKQLNQGLIQGSSQLIKGVGQVSNLVKTAKNKISGVKASAANLMDSLIAKAMAKINIGKTIESLEEFQKTNGKDVSDLINFLKKLQTVN